MIRFEYYDRATRDNLDRKGVGTQLDGGPELRSAPRPAAFPSSFVWDVRRLPAKGPARVLPPAAVREARGLLPPAASHTPDGAENRRGGDWHLRGTPGSPVRDLP